VARLRRSMIVVGIARTQFLPIGLGSVAGLDVSLIVHLERRIRLRLLRLDVEGVDLARLRLGFAARILLVMV
jgi:hypothetical protein